MTKRRATRIARQVSAELGQDVHLYNEGQRIILTGSPKRVEQIERIIRQLDSQDDLESF